MTITIEPEEHMPAGIAKMLRRQKYKLFGHSAVKTCHYTKTAVRGEKFCYKHKFYGIASHRCIQMTPLSAYCDQKCDYCWRPITSEEAIPEKWDSPTDIVEESVKAHSHLLNGFGSLVQEGRVNKKTFEDANTPKHVAISLSGEPSLYPHLSQLIEEFHLRGISTFLVSNGLHPEAFERLEKDGNLPTQLYVSIDTPFEDVHIALNKPVLEDSWQRLMKTLSMLKHLDTRTVMRMTLCKGRNDQYVQEFAKLISDSAPDFVELKSYMFVGFSRARMKEGNMMTHEEVKEWTHQILEHLPEYELRGEFADSRVTLIARKDKWHDRPTVIDFAGFFEKLKEKKAKMGLVLGKRSKQEATAAQQVLKNNPVLEMASAKLP